jgi:alanine dehydrogenase
MSEKSKKIPIPKSLTSGHFMTQTETLAVKQHRSFFVIGIPKEISLQENRVALIPSSVSTLVAHGHSVILESGAGIPSQFSDQEFAEAGAQIVFSPKEVYQSDILIKVAPPTIHEIDWMKPNQILISPLQLPLISTEYIQLLKSKRVTALAMEYIKDDSGTFPIVRIMSEMAGLNSVLTGAQLLSSNGGGKGLLLGGISGVPSARIVILGAGIVAEYATRAALGLGAEVRIFDNNIYKLKRIQNKVGRPLFTSALNPVFLEQELITADLVIGAIHSKTGRTPVVVSEKMVMKMKQGSVIIDVSIDQGGCIETSEVTSLNQPTFVKYDVVHYCVPNMASRVSRTASVAISNIITPMLLKAANPSGVEDLLMENPGMRHGVYTYKGCLTNTYLGERFELKSTDLDLLITSNL